MDLIGILIALLVFIVIVVCVKLAADYCEVAPPIRNIVLLICFLIFVLYLLRHLGVWL